VGAAAVADAAALPGDGSAASAGVFTVTMPLAPGLPLGASASFALSPGGATIVPSTTPLYLVVAAAAPAALGAAPAPGTVGEARAVQAVTVDLAAVAGGLSGAQVLFGLASGALVSGGSAGGGAASATWWSAPPGTPGALPPLALSLHVCAAAAAPSASPTPSQTPTTTRTPSTTPSRSPSPSGTPSTTPSFGAAAAPASVAPGASPSRTPTPSPTPVPFRSLADELRDVRLRVSVGALSRSLLRRLGSWGVPPASLSAAGMDALLGANQWGAADVAALLLGSAGALNADGSGGGGAAEAAAAAALRSAAAASGAAPPALPAA
jgi:hypothetical protein